MPNANTLLRAYKNPELTKVLRRVFSEGPENFSPEVLNYLFDSTKQGGKLYRYDLAPGELYTQGFNPSRRQRRFGMYDLPGLHWSPSKTNVLLGTRYEGEYPNIEGLVHPDSIIAEGSTAMATPSPTPYELARQQTLRTLMDQDKGTVPPVHTDFFKSPFETVQMSPGKVLAKIRTGDPSTYPYDNRNRQILYRILGMGPLAGLGIESLND